MLRKRYARYWKRDGGGCSCTDTCDRYCGVTAGIVSILALNVEAKRGGVHAFCSRLESYFKSCAGIYRDQRIRYHFNSKCCVSIQLRVRDHHRVAANVRYARRNGRIAKARGKGTGIERGTG